MPNMRRLGVYNESLPTKKSRTVTASDFLIGGIVGKFERKFNKAFAVNNPTEFLEIFGSHVDPNFYGPDSVKGFFDNVVGVNAKLYVSSHVGHTGVAIDAVVATASPVDGTPEAVIRIDAAYQGELEYGISGNRTGYTITNGTRFTTAASATALASAYTCFLDSVIGIKVGDIVKFALTGGAPVTAYHKITAVDEGAKSITWTDSVLHATSTLALDDIVSVPGFRLRIWRKDTKGVVSEVDTELGKIFCTTEALVTDFYVQNVFSTSKWATVTRLVTTPATLDLTFPIDVATITYLAAGADGTAPTTAAHWNNALTRLDNLPVRFIANPETTVEAIQKAMETYARARDDNPKVVANLPANQTKAQLITIGQNFQRSNDVLQVNVANWGKVTDPFGTSPLSPDREVPNVGHIMGNWIRSIGINGVHFIPAVKTNPIYGFNSLVGDTFLSDIDRTELAEAGINVLQDLTGYGIVVRNFFTPSIAKEFKFANGILMREFIKVSAKDSLQDAENTPNSLGRIQSDRMAILGFLYELWNKGSTGSVPIGETFGQGVHADGSATKPEEHFEVKADITNNPQDKIDDGERNLDTHFSFPAPGGSIRIGVGILLRS